VAGRACIPAPRGRRGWGGGGAGAGGGRGPEGWGGVEAWPGVAYRAGEAGCLFLEGRVPTLDGYSPKFWKEIIRPRYAEWVKANPPAFPWLTGVPA
jgi:hypothetical protein